MLATLLKGNFGVEDSFRNAIILIRRSATRYFKHHSILSMLKQHGQTHGQEVIEFRDDPSPDLWDTVHVFNRALLAVAPHGGGQSNMLFSAPETVLIEGLCYDRTNRVNLCFRNMAAALGLRYYGLVFNKQCMPDNGDNCWRCRETSSSVSPVVEVASHNDCKG